MAGQDDFLDLIPTDPIKNLERRMQFLEQARGSEQAKLDLWCMCSRSLLFFTRGFVWTYAPLLYERHPEVPFIPYPKQEEALREADAAMGDHDLVMEKSRDQGASWLYLIAIAWRWLFFKMQSHLLVSRNADYVDKPGNPKALFWKLDFLFERLPAWLMPPLWVRTSFHYENKENGSVIDGESTTGAVAAGDRRNSIFIDEYSKFDIKDGYQALASSQKSTKCRLVNATPNGAMGAYYDLVHMEGIKKLRLHWSDHPVQSEGLYTIEHGELKIIDEHYWRERLLDGGHTLNNARGSDLVARVLRAKLYKFILDGEYPLRSPYFDAECKRTPLKSIIAQELEIDYLGSGSPFFDPPVVKKLEVNQGLRPMLKGEVIHDGMTGDFADFKKRRTGSCSLWFNLDYRGRAPKYRDYVIGVDVSAGTGSSNSVISAWDVQTCTQALEYASPNVRPEELAGICAAIGRWIGSRGDDTPVVIYEQQGPGRAFGSRLMELDYNSLYKRTIEDGASSGQGKKIPGLAITKDLKRTILTEYGRALSAGEACCRSVDCIKEMSAYIYSKDGGVVHSGSAAAMDPSGAKFNHGDRVAAAALAWHVLKNLRHTRDETEELQDVPVGSMAWRIEQDLKKRREEWNHEEEWAA